VGLRPGGDGWLIYRAGSIPVKSTIKFIWAYGGVPYFIGKGLASLGNTPLDVKTDESGNTGSNPERPPFTGAKNNFIYMIKLWLTNAILATHAELSDMNAKPELTMTL